MVEASPTRLVLGGCFDPFHNGHLQLAQAALARYPQLSIHLLPSPPEACDSAQLNSWHRLAMLGKLTRDYDFLDIDFSALLLNSQSSYEVLSWLRRHLHIDRPGFILGGDQFMQLHRWQNAEKLLPMALWIVGKRQGVRAQDIEAQYQRLLAQGVCVDILTADIDSVSSSQLRQLLGDGQCVDHLVPTAIANYLKTHNIYQKK